MKFRNKNKNQAASLNQPFQHPNHRQPFTRRDFLAQGYIPMAAYLAVPSVLAMLEDVAMGITCTAPASAVGMTPFLVFDLAGGGNIAGSNVIVGKRGGQDDMLTNYNLLGLPASMNPKTNPAMINKDLGIAFHTQSALLAGIKAGAPTPTTLANVDGAIFCTTTQDDDAGNPLNPVYWIAKTGRTGEYTSLLGTSGSQSGGNSAVPTASFNPARRPVAITAPKDALGLVNPGKLGSLLTPADVDKIMQAARSMSSSRLAMFETKDISAQMKDLIECGYITSGELLKVNPADADVTKDTAAATAFNLAVAEQAKVATIAKMVLDGKAAAATVSLGGYDYHTGSRTSGETQDKRAGDLIGRVFELAALKQKDIMIYVFTDGGVVANATADAGAGGKLGWASDSGVRSAALSLVYKKDGKPAMRNNQRQIGAYTESQAIDTAANLISSNVNNLSKAIVANYLALHGMEGKLADAVGDNPFGANIEQYLAFQKLR